MKIQFIKQSLFIIFFILSTDYVFGQKIVLVDFEKTSNQNQQIEKNAGSGDSAQVTNASENRGGFVVSAYLGTAKTASTDLTIAQPSLNTNLTFENVRLRSRSFESPQYYGLRVGYFFPKASFVGVETEFIHLKVYSEPAQRVRATGTRRGTAINREIALGEIVQQYSISHGANFLLFNLAGRRGFWRAENSNRNRLILTARAGIGPTIPHTESSIEGQRQEQYELGRLGWQLAGGAEVKIWRGLYGLGEYKYTQSRQTGKVSAGEAESFLRTHHGVFGLSYHF